MLPYARLTPGSGFQADRALFYYAQRLIGIPALRSMGCALIAAGVRARHGDGEGWAPGAAHTEQLQALRRDGLAAMPSLVSDAQVAQVADYFMSQPVVDARGRSVALGDLGPGAGSAAYAMETVLACPGLLDIVNSPSVLRVAADYLGCKPTVSSLGVRWSFASPQTATRTQGFHRDLDDWRFLKLFIYLTDVDADSGPHCYVRASHATGFGWNAKAYTEDELKRRFGADSLKVVVGPRGTAFLADTLGVHRGVTPTARPRLILQVQYSLLPIFAFLYDPLEAASIKEPYCDRLLLRQSSGVTRRRGRRFGRPAIRSAKRSEF